MEVKIIVPKFPNGIAIGEERENLAVPVVVDYTAWIERHGTGALQILLQRPQDADPYPVTVTNDNGEAVWTPSETDMNFKGRGEIQLVYTAGDVIERSPVIMVISGRSLVADGDPPEPYETWLESLTELAAETLVNAQNAANSEEQAGEYANQALESADEAKTAAEEAEAAKTGVEAAEAAAGRSATLAREKAAEAAEAAQIAGENADYAQQQSIAAGYSAESAHDDAERAAQSADDAQAAAAGANQAETDAQSAASAAAGSAADAASAVTEVETKGAEQITAINQAGTTQIAAVDAAGAAQVQAIEDKGEEVIESIPSDYTELTDEVSNLKSSLYDPRTGLDQKAGLLRDTAEGAVASFVPDASVENLLGLTVEIEPVQDLHGYDSPWPGGGGKNKYDMNSDYYGQGLFWRANDGTLVNSSDYYASPKIPIKAETQYARTSGTSANIFYDANGDYLSTLYTGGTFTSPENAAFVAFNIANSVNHNTVQLEEGSSLSTYSPYSNICPISGWDAVEVEADGINLFDKTDPQYINGYFASAADAVIYAGDNFKIVYIPCKEKYTYTIKNPANNRVAIGYTKELPADNVRVYGATNTTITTGDDAKYVVAYVHNSNRDTATFEEVCNTLQIVLGNAAPTDYNAYAGSTYTIALGQTVYGAKLDLDAGTLTVDRVMVTLDNDSLLYQDGNNISYRQDFSDRKLFSDSTTGLICSAFIASVDASPAVRWRGAAQYRLSFLGTTVDTLTNLISAGQLNVSYPLATPIAIALDPVTIATIAGQTNNVWADAGDVSVEFAADLKTYIDSKIAAAVAALS